jgi:hypothetical protein
MGYKWKPSASQKAAYREKLQEKENLPIIQSRFALRTGCVVEFYSLNKGEIIKGKIINHSYGTLKNQHTFTILKDDDEKVLVKGRNLYPNLLRHEPGAESIEVNNKNR